HHDAAVREHDPVARPVAARRRVGGDDATRSEACVEITRRAPRRGGQQQRRNQEPSGLSTHHQEPLSVGRAPHPSKAGSRSRDNRWMRPADWTEITARLFSDTNGSGESGPTPTPELEPPNESG